MYSGIRKLTSGKMLCSRMPYRIDVLAEEAVAGEAVSGRHRDQQGQHDRAADDDQAVHEIAREIGAGDRIGGEAARV